MWATDVRRAGEFLRGTSENVGGSAASGGDLEMLKWARENDCPWDKQTCADAAMGGHLEVLKWARENGCPWDERTCAFAAEGGHLEMLKWARENDCPWNEDVRERGEGRPPRGAEVGARERLPVERRTRRGAEVARANARDRETCAPSAAATSRC